MRKNIYLSSLFILIATHAFSQPSIRDARKRSWQCAVYRINADTAEKYISKYVVFPEHYLNETPFTVWHADSLKYEELPVGNYLIFSTVENELLAEYYCQSNLKVFPLNNQHRVQLEVKDNAGKFPANVKAWVNRKEIKYDADINGFELKNKKPDEALIKITVPGDTLFMELSALDDMYNSSWQQWWTNFSYTKAGRIITWPIRKIKFMATRPASEWFRKRYRYNSSRNGYMIFNKPKYLPGDTVKFKAYILNKKGKQYKKGLNMFLEYTAEGRAVNKNIGVIKPVTPGAFVHEFVLGDSLESDRTYTITFKNKKEHAFMRSNFKIEDYLLDEVATYNLRSEKENYFRHDTLVFYANAKDANGLALMDGRVNLYLLAANIHTFYKEREFVPDTLWKGEKVLAIEGDTKFEIPARDFPDADLSLRAVVEFRNSNNEIQEKDVDIDFTADSRVVQVRQEGAYIVAEYMENGKAISRDGLLSFDDEDKETKIRFPYREKLNPYVEAYSFWAEDNAGKIIASEDFEAERNYFLSFGRIQQKDTIGFSLYNPNKIPVHYTVFNGNTILVAGSDTAEWISWKKVLPKKRIYNVEWNYIWAGKEQKGRNTIAVLDKILDTKISGAQTIYPGQTDTITVSIKDYKGNAAANVNLTAVSYNSQFKNDIRVNEPPYLQKFKTRRRILFDNYELDDAGFTKKLLLGRHQQWRNTFGLDTMKYYQLLFPKSDYAISSSVINEFAPQLAVHIVEGGVPQEIYMLYINREFAWYNGVTDKSVYAFSVVPGYTQIGIRLRNKYIEIDSIYLQPFYKHDISFDLDHLPAKAVMEKRDEFYTGIERNQVERQIWQLQNDSRTNYGYVWQNNKLVYIGSNNSHLIGPFAPADSLQFFKPGDFDFKFPFESGYQYRLTPMMARLEKRNIFPAIEKIILPKVIKTTWVLGDTVVASPRISYYKKPLPALFLKANDNTGSYSSNKTGSLKILLPKDSSFIYAILYSVFVDTTITRIRSYQPGNFYAIQPGRYNLILVTSSFRYLTAEALDIKANGTFCLKFNNPIYTSTDLFVEQLKRQDEELSKKEMKKYFEEQKENRKQELVTSALSLPEGNGMITGNVTDKKGKSPIPGGTVSIKGSRTAVAVKSDGSFSIKNIRPGKYVLVFSSVGYESKEISINVREDSPVDINTELVMTENHLSEVVVIGYGSVKRKSLTGSISSVRGEELTTSLNGKVAGVYVNGDYRYDSVVVRIRGIGSLNAGSKPLYVINGVPMDELPEGFEMDKAQVNILKDAAAINLYGARAANGVILITTSDFIPKTLREKFRDYAFWQPNLITDKNGEAKFVVIYPDNITGWQTFVVGMDKKRRLTKATAFTKSFKPLLAQLSTPQFLIEGDSSAFIGKVINYTTSGITLATDFRINDKVSYTGQKELNGNGAVTDALPVVAGTDDTLTAQYTITTSAGYSDGELRKIPVFRKGIEETTGNFWILDKDTAFSFIPDKNAGDIVLHAQNNTLSVLLDEIKYLKEYPYYCMEQTASKLTGLVMEKQIRQTLKQPFTEENAIQKFVSKLQKTQLFNGGWGWWEGGDANLSITNYVTRALLSLRSDALIESNIRNGVLYLQNRLPLLKKDELLNTLFTLSETGHEMDYVQYMNKFIFDSLSIHQQWQVIKIKQQQKMNYEKELKTVMEKKTETMLGGLHWGNDSWYWESNSMATTALAFKVLEKEKIYQPLLKQIIQFFLERRQGGRWQNTVESANTLAAILPTILNDNANFNSAAQLSINAPETIRIDTFPFTQTITNTNQPITINRSGGGLLYFTAWQKIFNRQPEPVSDKFIISSWFERTGNTIASLMAGEKVTMKIKVNVLKDAEYVQVEIPIPAGCTYAEKKQQGWKMHKEFLKNKMVLFIEKMDKGAYTYEIELEPRYSGNYHLNPVKAELMYFPVFYGRNEMKRIVVSK